MDTAPMDVADVIRRVNASNEAVEDQCLRACQAADFSTQSARAAELSACAAESATVAYRTVQAEHPRRRAARSRQVIFALITVALDGVACYFAAQALDGSQGATWVWTGLFLAVLAGGEVALDFYRDRNLRVWRTLVALTGIFVTLLGVLRFWFLATVGTDGLVPAVTGAFLFTVATAGFLCLGYAPSGRPRRRRPGVPAGRPERRGRPPGPRVRQRTETPRNATASSTPTSGT